MRVSIVILICLTGCVPQTDLPQSQGEIREVRPPVTWKPGPNFVEGRVVHGVSLNGVPGAQVSLSGTVLTTMTDEMGRYRLPRRPSFHFVDVKVPGFLVSQTRLGTETRLWPEHLDEDDAWYVLRRRGIGLDTDDLTDPDLRTEAVEIIRNARSSQHLSPTVRGADESPLVFKQQFRPPESIRIYRRGPENNSCQGRVDVIPLEDYVKGVVPHEWIASWADESLRAGSIAARSYAWGWINAGGKYDCADLDDTTRSQVYREDRTERANAAVDSTRGMAVVENGAVVRSEYSAENGNPTAFGVEDPLCEGRELFGHGRGMCQWGTQRWATQRDKTAEWMVDHYYPNASVGGAMSADQPQIQLQQRLARIDPVRCPMPAAMFDCADFVDQSWSNGLFDLFRGTRMTLTVDISNQGQRAANELVFRATTDDRFLVIDDVMADGETQFEDGSMHLTLDTLAAGDTISVAITLSGVGYSAPTGAPVSFRSWVASIDEGYEKVNWNSAPTDSIGQSFNGGDLKSLFEVDIFDPRRWTWSSGMEDMLEGWMAHSPAEIQASADGGLMIPVQDGPVFIDSPYLPATATGIQEVFLSVEPSQTARLWWRRPDEPFNAQDTLVLSAESTLVNPGLIPDDVAQFRLETSASATIQELSLRHHQGAPQPSSDAAVLPSRDASSTEDTGTVEPLDGTVMPQFDGPHNAVRPEGAFRPRGNTLRATHTGGCQVHNAPPWGLLLLLPLFWLRWSKRDSS